MSIERQLLLQSRLSDQNISRNRLQSLPQCKPSLPAQYWTLHNKRPNVRHEELLRMLFLNVFKSKIRKALQIEKKAHFRRVLYRQNKICIESSLLSGSFEINFSPFSTIKVEELTAGSDEKQKQTKKKKNTAPRRFEPGSFQFVLRRSNH